MQRHKKDYEMPEDEEGQTLKKLQEIITYVAGVGREKEQAILLILQYAVLQDDVDCLMKHISPYVHQQEKCMRKEGRMSEQQRGRDSDERRSKRLLGDVSL
jgi:hypothetical protein